MDVVQHQILSLDFWQDTVSYEGKNFPSGTIGCDALNIPAALIKQITELCGSLNLFMGAMQLGMANAELFTSARESALQIVHKLKDIPPFSYLDEKQITAYIQKVFSNEYLENAMAYAKSLASGNLMNALDPQYQKALTLLRVVPVLAHLGYSLEQFQDTMLQFAESLNTAEQERSPSGYAASFGDFFSSNPSLSEEDGSWMSLTNASVQYVPAIQPGSDTPQLVKRMHYVTLSRTSAFSRQMSLFFKCYINGILEGLQVSIVYAGGDDVFLVGAWNDVLEAAQRIQRNFTAFSCGALTLSAGIGIFDDHYPIRLSAEETAALEEAAKHLPGKNAVALFTPERKAVRDAKGNLLVQPEQGHIYAWDTFRTKVLTEKVGCLQSFFGKDNAEHGNAMLYNLLALLREAENAVCLPAGAAFPKKECTRL